MTVEQPGAERRSRLGARERALVIVLVIIAVVAGLFFALTRGSDEIEGAPVVGRPTTKPTPALSPSDEPPPETSEVFDGRDPFQPLVTEVVDGATPTATPTSGVVGGGDANGDGAPDEPRRVSLLDIFREDGERIATVEVDGDQFTVREGETFADSFRVLDLSGECGTFVFGDERFTLCIGQEVNK